MSDFDKTVYSGSGGPGLSGTSQPPAKPAANTNKLFIIGGIGCALVLCVVLLAGIAFIVAGDQIRELAGLGTETVIPVTVAPTEELTATPAPTEAAEVSPEAESGSEGQTEAGAADVTDTPAVSSEPFFGPITFALGATETYEPVDPGVSFEEGITEAHAIFDYSGMSPENTWERVWYLDGNEILRNSATWTDREQGRFDYFIDAGGDPLASGEWTLELYVDGQLLTEGSFTIEAEQPAVAQVADTPTSAPEPTATPTPKPVSAASSGGGVYQLVYTKWDGGQHSMYIADTNGNNQQFIMHRAAGPSWTPNGRTIFFYGEEGVDHQDRNNVPDVTNCDISGVSNGILAMDVPSPPNDVCLAKPNFFQGPGWNDGTARWANVSPDGSMVAYDAKPGGNFRIYFLGTADNQQFRFEIIGEQGDWSPDSQKVVYRSGRDGITGIWISNRDDTGHTNITQIGSDSFPAWSPDGETIAFSREVDGNVDIYTMNIDGSNIQRLTDAPGPDSLPIYTPSGDIIFRSARSGNWGIWKMSGSGGNQTEIIANAGVGPDWAYSKMDVH